MFMQSQKQYNYLTFQCNIQLLHFHTLVFPFRRFNAHLILLGVDISMMNENKQ